MPVLFSLLGRSAGLFILNNLKSSYLSIILGILIIITALFQLFFKNKINIKHNHINGAITGSLSGLLGGVTGTGGPPLVVYYMNSKMEKYQYMATIQFSFLVGAVYTITLLSVSGYYTIKIIQFCVAAVIGSFFGSLIGLKVFHKIKRDVLLKIINIILLLMGISLIVKTIL